MSIKLAMAGTIMVLQSVWFIPSAQAAYPPLNHWEDLIFYHGGEFSITVPKIWQLREAEGAATFGSGIRSFFTIRFGTGALATAQQHYYAQQNVPPVQKLRAIRGGHYRTYDVKASWSEDVYYGGFRDTWVPFENGRLAVVSVPSESAIPRRILDHIVSMIEYHPPYDPCRNVISKCP